MSIGPLTSSIGWTRGLTQIREQMIDLQRQLATGNAASTYGGYGRDATTALAMRSTMSQIESYQSVIETVQLRTSVMTTVFDRLTEIGQETKSATALSTFDVGEGGQTDLQRTAATYFEEVVALLNTDAADRYLFGGRATDDEPVADADVILEGDTTRAGFQQVVEERRLADLGADGLGRLSIPAAVGPAVSFSEDVAGSPYGFKIDAISSDLTGTTVTGPAGSPVSATVTFSATLPEAGETISVDLTLPDGTTTTVELTAVAAGAGGDPNTFEIGADENATATNFQAALTAAVETAASTELSSASAFAAADDFFGNPPQRVDGPPFDTATAQIDGTEADTVYWYTGDTDPTADARDSSIAKVDDNMYVSYGARADEEAFTVMMKNLAVLAVESYDDTVATEQNRYAATTSRVTTNMSYANGEQSIESVYQEIITVQYVADQADQRHTATSATAEDILAGVEGVDTNEIAVSLLTLQTRLEASYSVTAMLSQLNLTNYL